MSRERRLAVTNKGVQLFGGAAGGDPIRDIVAFIGQAEQLDGTDSFGDAGELGADIGHMRAAGIVIIGQQDNLAALKPMRNLGLPLAGAAMITCCNQSKLGEVVAIFLAFAHKDGRRGIGKHFG